MFMSHLNTLCEALGYVSCTGYYGNSDSATFNEGSASGRDYLAEVCREWEAAANAAQVRLTAAINQDFSFQ